MLSTGVVVFRGGGGPIYLEGDLLCSDSEHPQYS